MNRHLFSCEKRIQYATAPITVLGIEPRWRAIALLLTIYTRNRTAARAKRMTESNRRPTNPVTVNKTRIERVFRQSIGTAFGEKGDPVS
jgi:hypothetical protein